MSRAEEQVRDTRLLCNSVHYLNLLRHATFLEDQAEAMLVQARQMREEAASLENGLLRDSEDLAASVAAN